MKRVWCGAESNGDGELKGRTWHENDNHWYSILDGYQVEICGVTGKFRKDKKLKESKLEDSPKGEK